MTILLFANNAQTTLAANLVSSATTATLATGSGALFPNPGAGEAFKLTFQDAATGNVEEIVLVTAMSGDTITTMLRGQENTTPQNFIIGDIAQLRNTAGTQASFVQQQNSAQLSSLGIGAAAPAVGGSNPLVVLEKDAIGAAIADVIALVNSTAATSGVQQYSPSLRLSGQGWRGAASASWQSDFVIYNQTQSPTAQGTLVFASQTNGGGYATKMTLSPGGSIGTATWGGSTITVPFGGTGKTSYSIGDMLWANSTTSLQAVSGNASTSAFFLSQTGDGTTPGAPAWLSLSQGSAPFTTFESSDIDVTLGIGECYIYTGSSGATAHLPPLANALGSIVAVKNEGSLAVTVVRQGSDQIYDEGLVNSIEVLPGSSLYLVACSSNWAVISKNFVSSNSITAPTSTASPPSFTSYFGGSSKALGTPDLWASIVVNSQVYKIPLYA